MKNEEELDIKFPLPKNLLSLDDMMRKYGLIVLKARTQKIITETNDINV